ncbi:hypothetical protein [Planctomycetes bacterium TBK1r]|uniref:Uncharacterized protein n=1 Tax=Stieleria magnilauensis TaxID=2527963 RepID=A0ABX5XLB5_9BACT|nr:hypothetical protein TBK1r_10850 [Planctomycetes bacterium TBK1r]
MAQLHKLLNKLAAKWVILVAAVFASSSLLSAQEQPPQSLEKKMQRFQQRAERWHRAGEIMREFHPLMKEGEFDRAEAMLDRALSILESGTDPQAAERLRKFRRQTDETHYIILPVPEAGHLHGGNLEAFEQGILRTKRQLGSVADPTRHNWGFHLMLPAWRFDPEHLFSPNASPQVIARSVEGAIEVALRHDVAVYITVENLEWDNRPDLWNFNDEEEPGYDPANAKNVEWMDWNGTPHPHRYRDWGRPEQMPPVICYNSLAVEREVSRLAEQVIGPAIAAGLKKLADTNKQHLFAGVTVGAEPALPNYSVIDKVNPRIAEKMERDGVPRRRLGYNALTNLGYGRDNPPADFAATLAKVNQDYISLWARNLAKGGVPSNKMYSHVAAGAGVVGSPGVEFTNAPISIAFAESCRPGWTTYPVGPLQHDFGVLYEALAAHNNPPWASTEATPSGIGPGGTSMREYLQRHFDFGATVVVFNTGATDPEFARRLHREVWGEDALHAYQEFLARDE